MGNPKHRFKDEPKSREFPKAFSIGFLVFCTVVLIGTFIFIFAIKADQDDVVRETTEPMTMGIILIDDNGETVIPTSPPPTVKPTTKPTESSPTSPIEPQVGEEQNPAQVSDDSSATDNHNDNSPSPTEQQPNQVTGLLAAHHLIDIDNPDTNYVPAVIELSDYDREQAAKVIMGELGGNGYGAACLVAQCLRDTMIYEGYTSIDQVISNYQYNGYNNNPDEDCYVALDYVFGGGMAVEHRILYFYAPSQGNSPWHESQEFVVDFRGVRFFDSWY